MIFLALITSACVTMQDTEASQEYRADVVANLSPEQPVSQTFTLNRPLVNKAQIWFNLDRASVEQGGRLVAEIFRSPRETTPVTTVSYSLQALAGRSNLTLEFPDALPGSPGSQYLLRLRSTGGQVQLLGRLEDAYPGGNLSIGDQAVDADLSFRLAYEYNWQSAIEDTKDWVGQIWLAIPFLALLWLPGRLILRLSSLDRSMDWGKRSAIAIGLSCASIPLVILWTTFFGLHWSRISVLLVFALIAIIYAWVVFKKHSGRFLPRLDWISLGLGIVFISSLALRLAMVRDMSAPAWVDSVHHALLSRLIFEQGAYPADYSPFVDVAASQYHPGFHALTALFQWLSAQELSFSLLLLGQVLNACMVFSIYLFTTSLVKSRLSGLIAAIVVGFFTPMPAYYTSWGRYTQLTGLLLLPVAFAVIQESETILLQPAASIKLWLHTWNNLPQTHKKNLYQSILLTAVVSAGLLLIHYRVLVFLAILLLIDLAIRSFDGLRRAQSAPPGEQPVNSKEVPAQQRIGFLYTVVLGLVLFAITSILALVFTLPWWPGALRSLILPAAGLIGSAQPFSDFSWGFLNTGLGLYTLALAGLGLLWGVLRRERFAFLLILWALVLFILANLGVFGLPGAVLVNNISVTITLFMPIAVSIGYLLDWVLRGWLAWIPLRWQKLYWSCIAVAFVVIASFGARSLLPIINPGTLLFRQADHTALSWIQANVPQGETFLINPFNWGYGLYAGNDGGYWISPIAGKATLPPPVLYGLDFNGGKTSEISELTQQAISLREDPAALSQFLSAQGIHYLYTGARGGVYSPQLLKSSAEFELLYENQGTYIFRIKQTSD